MFNSFWHEFARASLVSIWKCNLATFQRFFYFSFLSIFAAERCAPLFAVSFIVVTSATQCIFTTASEAVWICLTAIEFFDHYIYHYIYAPPIVNLSMSTLFLSRLRSLNGSIESIQATVVKATLLRLSLSWRNRRDTRCTSLRTTSINFAVAAQ